MIPKEPIHPFKVMGLRWGVAKLNDQEKTAGQRNLTVHLIESPAACILGALAFACMSAWGVCLVYAPALPLLSFLPLDQGIVCLLTSCAVSMLAYLACARFPHVLIDKAKSLIFPGMLLFYGPIAIVGVASWMLPSPLPAPLVFAAWAISGIGWIVPSAQGMLLFSLMSPRWTALSLAGGGIIATPLFLLVGGLGVKPLAVIAAVMLPAVSGGIAFYLLHTVNPDDIEHVKEYKIEHRTLSTSVKTSVTVIAHGISYGFIVIMISSLGLHAILISGAAAIISSLIAFVWARRRSKSSWTTESAQRITVPLIIASLLFLPFCNEAGKIICGSVSIAAFAYVTLMEWTGQVVKNAEFQLFPLHRFALGRLAQWLGFLIGAFIAYIMFYHSALSPLPLMLVVCILAVLIITAFVIYDNSKDEEEDQLLDVVLGDPTTLIIDPPKNAAPFRERCDALIDKFQLSSREAEVFRYLAKGRNAEYIQQKLYISANTVKTHISHIYKKMGINNQQWLIDLVDERDKHKRPVSEENEDSQRAQE